MYAFARTSPPRRRVWIAIQLRGAAPVTARPTARLVRFVRFCCFGGLFLVDDLADVFNLFLRLEGHLLCIPGDRDLFLVYLDIVVNSWYRKGKYTTGKYKFVCCPLNCSKGTCGWWNGMCGWWNGMCVLRNIGWIYKVSTLTRKRQRLPFHIFVMHCTTTTLPSR